MKLIATIDAILKKIVVVVAAAVALLGWLVCLVWFLFIFIYIYFVVVDFVLFCSNTNQTAARVRT